LAKVGLKRYQRSSGSWGSVLTLMAMIAALILGVLAGALGWLDFWVLTSIGFLGGAVVLIELASIRKASRAEQNKRGAWLG
jgi:hypothetical protein